MQKIIIIIIALFLSFSANAQEISKIQKAFENSYKFEKDNNLNESINKLIEVYSDTSYEINLRLGWLYYQKGDFKSSEKYYSIASAILPYSEEAKYGLILPMAANAKWDAVAVIYKQILTISPNNVTANYRLGLLYYNQKKFGYAQALFEKVVNLYPFGYDGLIMYAWNSLQLGKSKEARILFNKVLIYSPNDKSALEGLAILDK
ncbi:MAG: tetratricopeptide repeat protein [Bacteroidota bacterium]